MTKVQIYDAIKAFEHADIHNLFKMLLTACVEDLRKKNDDARGDDVFRNQGAIKELKTMHKKLSGREKFKEHNGAFDE